MKKMYSQKNNIRLFSIFLLFSLSILGVQAQKRLKVSDDYIVKYSSLAVTQMNRHKIPASIILAQGLLESGSGKSPLATDGNNHFGIKCHKDWTGGKIHKDDDTKDECFRKYKKAEDSFEDHSKFLTERERYNSLFNLRQTDYRGWAKGLQQAGYATDKAYANKLIKMIEDYELYKFDSKGGKKKTAKGRGTKTTSGRKPVVVAKAPKPNVGGSTTSGKKQANQNNQNNPNYENYDDIPYQDHIPYKTHELVYVVAYDGDTYQNIADEFEFYVKDLYDFNEVPEDFPLKEGDLVYLQKKRSKAQKPYYEHIIQVGESMHSISQLYGMQVKNLYKMNKKRYEDVPVEGDILKLR